MTQPLLHSLFQALQLALYMTWDILWALILGFLLSAVVQAVVSKKEIVKLLPDDSPRSISIACGLGAASSSCSYAAVALARSLFRKGADFTAAISFQVASTNLVVELGVLLAVLLGWQFTAGEFLGAPLMIALMVLLFRRFLTRAEKDVAHKQADRNLAGRMEGHAAMDMSMSGGTIWSRLFSSSGATAVSHFFFMDWASVWIDIGAGLLLAGALAAWVPNRAWQAFFLTSHARVAWIWGPLVGPLISMLSFVCSVGNVPLAAVLWQGGASFGGVLAFLFADLIILPILDIYRRYYGRRMSLFLLATLYASMSVAALVVEFVFRFLHWIPRRVATAQIMPGITANYTSILNAIFLGIAAVLAWRFFTTGGPAMIHEMDQPVSEGSAHCHHDGGHGGQHGHGHHGHGNN